MDCVLDSQRLAAAAVAALAASETAAVAAGFFTSTETQFGGHWLGGLWLLGDGFNWLRDHGLLWLGLHLNGLFLSRHFEFVLGFFGRFI